MEENKFGSRDMMGIVSFVSAILSIFTMFVIFAPISAITGILGLKTDRGRLISITSLVIVVILIVIRVIDMVYTGDVLPEWMMRGVVQLRVKGRVYGEVSEWFKVLAWKASVSQKGTVGSNPILTAMSALWAMNNEQ